MKRLLVLILCLASPALANDEVVFDVTKDHLCLGSAENGVCLPPKSTLKNYDGSTEELRVCHNHTTAALMSICDKTFPPLSFSISPNPCTGIQKIVVDCPRGVVIDYTGTSEE